MRINHWRYRTPPSAFSTRLGGAADLRIVHVSLSNTGTWRFDEATPEKFQQLSFSPLNSTRRIFSLAYHCQQRISDAVQPMNLPSAASCPRIIHDRTLFAQYDVSDQSSLRFGNKSCALSMSFVNLAEQNPDSAIPIVMQSAA
ncbi:hypothetical protein M422DRAFT_276311 [Sphaerobolus stellatus SS14]|uniref:Uncharacterized protein n=1 Tax=Sphaerobolus stellatus (strain SS14) TaxID=990650 RepID=A0A0C9UDG4_SPHS4|nr:hypothetical protein M422DRAFT_276473 [Sphaerobolus stellatus SS14]KIJ23170.1 hypothetical protein M422DRAFT_276311 [Sphaerobolus stellatus SS14]